MYKHYSLKLKSPSKNGTSLFIALSNLLCCDMQTRSQIQFNSRFFLYVTREIHFDHSNKSFCRVLWLQMTIKIEYPTWVCVYARCTRTPYFSITFWHCINWLEIFRFGIIKSTKYTRQLSLLWIWPTRCVGYRTAACTFLISGKQFTTVMINR